MKPCEQRRRNTHAIAQAVAVDTMEELIRLRAQVGLQSERQTNQEAESSRLKKGRWSQQNWQGGSGVEGSCPI